MTGEVALQQGELDAETEGIQIVSYSELSTFRQCPLKHHLSYQRRWTKPTKPGGALDKGTTWHNVLEAHYKVLASSRYNGKTRTPAQEKRLLAAARAATVPFLWDLDSGRQTEVQALVAWMYDGYVDRYGCDPHWKILAIEHQIKTPLRDNDGKQSRYVLKAKIDLLVWDLILNSMWVVDHKSGADLPHKLDLEWDDQFGLYQWSCAQVGRPVQGTIHSAARTTRNKGDFPEATHGNAKPQTLEQRFHRTPMARGQQELKNLALDAFNVAQAAYPPEGMVRSIYSSPNPRNCGFMCDMKQAHLLMRHGRDPDTVMREQGYKVDFTRH